MPAALRLSELAALVGATAPAGPDPVLTGVATLKLASPSDISFLEQDAYLEQARASGAGVILTRRPFEPARAVLLQVSEPRLAFTRCMEFFARARPLEPGVHPTAVVDPSSRVSELAFLGPCVVIGERCSVGAGARLEAGVLLGDGVEIGMDCHLHPGVVVLAGSKLGRGVIVQARSVIGSDGFGYVQENGRHSKIPHLGNVVVEDGVEIGAGCCIDRASLGSTTIGRGTKIDNLVHIAHNVEIGQDCLIIAQVGISGSVKIGDRATLAGKVGVAGHLEIGAGATVAAAARVVRSVPPGATVAGWPAVDIDLWRRSTAILKRLPRIWEGLRALERKRSDEDPPYSDS